MNKANFLWSIKTSNLQRNQIQAQRKRVSQVRIVVSLDFLYLRRFRSGQRSRENSNS